MKPTLHRLLQERWQLLTGFSLLYLIFLAWGFVLLPLLAFEIILRLLLRYTYGRHYRYSLYNYFLIDDPLYGNCFRPNINSETIDFLICDKYIFRHEETVDTVNLAKNKSQRVRFSINSRSFRGPEFTSAKTPGTLRIFCVGGSTTAGNSVNDDQTWPAFLESFLRARGHRAEVINAGVQGWYSYQDLLRFKNELVKYEPDLVLINQSVNDEFAFSSQNLGQWWSPRVARHFMEEKYLFIPPNRLLADTHSLLFHLLMRLVFKNFVFDRQMPFTNPRRWACLERPEYLAAWFDNLVEFARVAAAHQVSLRLIDPPCLVETHEAQTAPLKTQYLAASQVRNQALIRAAGEFIPVIDAAGDWRRLSVTERAPLFHDYIHMTAVGNRRLAESIGQTLLAESWFDTPRPANLKPPVLPTAEILAKLKTQAITNDAELGKLISDKISELIRAVR